MSRIGGSNNWRTQITGEDWMRNVEKRILSEERRPQIRTASDILGPGFAPHAVLTQDWNSPETTFNGIFYSEGNNVLNSPDNAAYWIGDILAQQDGFGVQYLYEYRVGSPADHVRSYIRRFYSPGGGGTIQFGAWESTDWRAPDVQVFTASGTWNKPADAKHVHVRAVGAGGGGGGSATTAAGQINISGGGGSGGYSENFVPASSLGASVTVTVGTGGAGGAAGATGTSGGDTIFTGFARGDGGSGGASSGSVAPPAIPLGGGGGGASLGAVNIVGSRALPGIGLGTGDARGGAGAHSLLSGQSVFSSINSNGSAGQNYGGGGGGSCNLQSQGTNRTGGAGADGIVIVVTYF